MGKMYDCLPFFKEIVEKMLSLRKQKPDEDCLRDIVQHFIADKSDKHSIHGISHIDPLSFLYTIATNGYKKRFPIIQKWLKITAEIPTDDTFPQGDARNSLFQSEGDDNSMSVDKLWKLFALAYEGKTNDSSMSELFSGALKIRGVGVAKLTQTLYLINPQCFIPIDERIERLFPEKKKNLITKSVEKGGISAYLALIQRLKGCFQGCELYELNHLAYDITGRGITPDFDTNWHQISSQQEGAGEGDFIDDWFAESHVSIGYTQKDGNDSYRIFAGLKKGTIVIARRGMQIFHGLAIIIDDTVVHGTENDRPRRQVVWVIKDPNRSISGFARNTIAHSNQDKVYNKIVDAYPEAWKFLDSFSQENAQADNGSAVAETGGEYTPATHSTTYPKNLILYGPPGTGKTWITSEKAVEICGRLGDNTNTKTVYAELVENGQVHFVTFHQSYGYEEFVEGIRPVLDGEADTVSYEVKHGIFRRICEQASENSSENYVLIIDEINRGNVSRIFGELITLIENDKRSGEENALSVSLPYSGDKFSVPSNLYIIATMNTADRSLVTLDTALRRRFKFEEMRAAPEKLEKVSVSGIDIQGALTTMNKEIRKQYDRDHEIGYAYFWSLKELENAGSDETTKVKELQGIFQHKILPQLQEYFFDDPKHKKVQAILMAFFPTDKVPADTVKEMLGDDYYTEYYREHRDESSADNE